MKILAHRGYWKSRNEQNTEVAFRRALGLGFGIETDVRDFRGGLVISHDVPVEPKLTLLKFKSILAEYTKSVIAINVKSDGLQELINTTSLEEVCEYFCFDMSIPDTLGYEKFGIPFYSRLSDIEPTPACQDSCNGIWLDNFVDEKLDIRKMKKSLEQNKRLALVSPELHGFDYSVYWSQLKNLLSLADSVRDRIGLCTDMPEEANRYFNE